MGWLGAGKKGEFGFSQKNLDPCSLFGVFSSPSTQPSFKTSSNLGPKFSPIHCYI